MKIPDFIRKAIGKPEVIVDNDYVLLSQLREQFENVKRNASRISFKGQGSVLGITPMSAAAPGRVCNMTLVIPEDDSEFESLQAEPTTDEGLKVFLHKLKEDIVEYEQNHSATSELTNIKKAVDDLLSKGTRCEVSPSRLVIPRYGEIVLEDYGCGFSLHPLPRAVLILFLRHPEGIILKDRKNYSKELREIYGLVCSKDTNEQIVEHCDRLVDVLDGSMDQKITIINSIFKKNLTMELAEKYQILGERGGVKSIKLDRSLVKFDQEIEDIPLTVLK